MLLEQGQLKIPRALKETGTLVRELTEIEVRQRSGGRVQMGAEGEGQHDDLAMALALACWRGGGRRLRSGLGLGGWFEGSRIGRETDPLEFRSCPTPPEPRPGNGLSLAPVVISPAMTLALWVAANALLESIRDG